MNTNDDLFNKIEKENIDYLYTLPKQEREDILDVHNYLLHFDISGLESEMIKKDLVQIGLDAHNRGESFRAAIGNKAAFCRDFAANYRKKPLFEKIIVFLSRGLTVLTTLVGISWLLIGNIIITPALVIYFIVDCFLMGVDDWVSDYLIVIKNMKRRTLRVIRSAIIFLINLAFCFQVFSHHQGLIALPAGLLLLTLLVLLGLTWGLRLYYWHNGGRNPAL